MKKILAVLLASLPFISNAQFNWGHNFFEVGLAGGVMNYSGELTNSIFDYKHLHPGGAIFARYNLGSMLSFKGQVAYGQISGDDRDSKDLRNQVRNLHFKSNLLEGSLSVEFNLMGYHPRGHERMFSPYAFLGIAVFNFNSKAEHFDPDRSGEWVELHPLQTEGVDYKRTQISIPLGLGMKFAINSHLNLGLEVGFRKTFTDYIDDVATNYLYERENGAFTNNYSNTPYDADEFGNKSMQELMSDRTYEYIANREGWDFQNDFDQITPQMYDDAVSERGGQQVRGDKSTDWYIFTAITVSYNFIDNGLAAPRKRRKRKKGCKSARF